MVAAGEMPDQFWAAESSSEIFEVAQSLASSDGDLTIHLELPRPHDSNVSIGTATLALSALDWSNAKKGIEHEVGLEALAPRGLGQPQMLEQEEEVPETWNFVQKANASHRFLGTRQLVQEWRKTGVVTVTVTFTATIDAKQLAMLNAERERAAIRIQAHQRGRHARLGCAQPLVEHRLKNSEYAQQQRHRRGHTPTSSGLPLVFIDEEIEEVVTGPSAVVAPSTLAKERRRKTADGSNLLPSPMVSKTHKLPPLALAPVGPAFDLSLSTTNAPEFRRNPDQGAVANRCAAVTAQRRAKGPRDKLGPVDYRGISHRLSKPTVQNAGRQTGYRGDQKANEDNAEAQVSQGRSPPKDRTQWAMGEVVITACGLIQACFSAGEYKAIADVQKFQVVKEFIDLLGKVSFFGKLTTWQKLHIAAHVDTVRMPDGYVILEEGKDADSMFLIKVGECAVPIPYSLHETSPR